ncbi:hypothetical protein L226DRAFT_616915 [Lentinus tigrinus ALCF2SS1-7]|uniref:Fungal-type protein kinase domain-containing protein n=1 Tax=Lentinus tigrinus ALCF2SS1-6 TaxID=1328759 RepID=A0A5C2RVK7_9APHY|nr:hypothetical protein L227DRAFT_657573 [Lentinus tigrinus ALCF2SS1-6]RPD69386.1 hypothetical protein L226DRAFT_616915 [Lentinus tigrinus ALCF2SS1-7]
MTWIEAKTIGEWFNAYVPGDHPPPGTAFEPYKTHIDATERELRSSWRDGLNRTLQTVGWTAYEALDTSEESDLNSTTGRKTSCPAVLGIYPKNRPENWLDCDESDELADEDDQASSSYNSEWGTDEEEEDQITRVPLRTRVSWGWAELIVVLLKDQNDAAGPRTTTALYWEKVEDQLAGYANEVFTRQHRLAVFMIVVYSSDTARLIRLDRRGAVTTPLFNYVRHPEVIGTFLFRLSGMGPAGRGYDPTVSAASADEERLFRALHEQREHPLSATTVGLREAATPGWLIYKVTIESPFSTDGTPVRRDSPVVQRELLVGKPASVKTSLVGRGTRGFVAYDLTSQQVVYLKDSWRPDLGSQGVRSEYDNYMLIRESLPKPDSVMNTGVPTLLGGGDVTYCGIVQRTCTPTSHLYVHFRLVLKEVCRRLEDFKSSKQLLQAVAWACAAHMQVWESCRLLHRDVSAGNILIYDLQDSNAPDSARVIGLLSDWDLAEVDDGVTTLKRSGTWSFMSARLQRFPEKPHEVADDLESFYHVLNWCALLHLPHTRSNPEILDECIYRLFDFATADDPPRGHPDKLEYMESGWTFVRILRIRSGVPHPLDLVLQELASLFQLHYYHARYPTGSPQRFALNVEIVTEDDSPPDDDLLIAIGLPHLTPGVESLQTSSEPTTTAEPRDPAKSPLCDHKHVVACLFRRQRTDAWPVADRVR